MSVTVPDTTSTCATSGPPAATGSGASSPRPCSAAITSTPQQARPRSSTVTSYRVPQFSRTVDVVVVTKGKPRRANGRACAGGDDGLVSFWEELGPEEYWVMIN